MTETYIHSLLKNKNFIVKWFSLQMFSCYEYFIEHNRYQFIVKISYDHSLITDIHILHSDILYNHERDMIEIMYKLWGKYGLMSTLTHDLC